MLSNQRLVFLSLYIYPGFVFTYLAVTVLKQPKICTGSGTQCGDDTSIGRKGPPCDCIGFIIYLI